MPDRAASIGKPIGKPYCFRSKTYRTSSPIIEAGVFILKTANSRMVIEAIKPDSVAVRMSGQWTGEEGAQLVSFLNETCRRVTGVDQDLSL